MIDENERAIYDVLLAEGKGRFGVTLDSTDAWTTFKFVSLSKEEILARCSKDRHLAEPVLTKMLEKGVLVPAKKTNDGVQISRAQLMSLRRAWEKFDAAAATTQANAERAKVKDKVEEHMAPLYLPQARVDIKAALSDQPEDVVDEVLEEYAKGPNKRWTKDADASGDVRFDTFTTKGFGRKLVRQKNEAREESAATKQVREETDKAAGILTKVKAKAQNEGVMLKLGVLPAPPPTTAASGSAGEPGSMAIYHKNRAVLGRDSVDFLKTVQNQARGGMMQLAAAATITGGAAGAAGAAGASTVVAAAQGEKENKL